MQGGISHIFSKRKLKLSKVYFLQEGKWLTLFLDENPQNKQDIKSISIFNHERTKTRLITSGKTLNGAISQIFSERKLNLSKVSFLQVDKWLALVLDENPQNKQNVSIFNHERTKTRY